MPVVISLASLATAAVSAWMVVMYFALRHPGYQWRAAIAAAICFGAVSLVGGRPWRPLRVPVAVWGAALAAFGIWALASPQDDGWTIIAAVIFLAEGSLAVWASATS